MIAIAETLLTLQEVADRLRVARSTVKRYIRKGTLEVVRVGGGYRVRTQALERYIVENTKPAEGKK